MLAVVFIAYALIVLFEVPGLVKKRMWRELAVFSLYWTVALTLSVPQVLQVELPNPNKAIEALFRPLVEWLK
ncbi:MAG: hypothetical protein K6T29_09300 [Peptococcaceae bacterium]|nr:hypothetical protein [Peptococcaceae bacterium]